MFEDTKPLDLSKMNTLAEISDLTAEEIQIIHNLSLHIDRFSLGQKRVVNKLLLSVEQGKAKAQDVRDALLVFGNFIN